MGRRIIVPDTWMGESVQGSMEIALQGIGEDGIPPESEGDGLVTPSMANIPDKESYIILPGRKHGDYEYPDMLVSMQRTHLGKNWQQAFDGLRQEEAFMINLRQYADFLNLLRSGAAYNGKGDSISPSQLSAVYDDIAKVGGNWRSEHIDAKFNKVDDGKRFLVIPKSKMQITYHSLDRSGKYVEYNEPLGDCFMSNKTPGISLEHWLKYATDQGLPPENNEEGQLYYWAPANGKVAGFYADSGRVGLYCGRDSAYTYPSLGVRACREKK